jgi:hypothetical protein
VRYTVVNLYQSTCTKQLVPINLHQPCINYHQHVPQPVINLYHKQVHQPCTNLTKLWLILESELVERANYVSTMYLNQNLSNIFCIDLRKHHQKNLSSLEFRPSLLHLLSEIRLRYPLVTSFTYRYSICSSVFKIREPCLLFILSCSFLKGLPFNHLNPLSLF